jgi:prepilin signal peptidase PulO-like enzyme (type II secretory pathway)
METLTVDRRTAYKFIALLIAVAAVSAVAAVVYDDWWAIFLTTSFSAVFLVLTISDLEQRIIPNRIVYPALALALATSWLWPDRGVQEALLGGGIAFAMTLVFYVLSRGGFGGGDVKMLWLVGLVVGYPAVMMASLITALAGGLLALVLLLLGKAERRQYLPYAPFLTLGAVVALLTSA